MAGERLILLDTHAWLWWVASPEKLSSPARAAIGAAAALGVATVSVWEIAMLAQRGRISLDRPAAGWVAQALAVDRVVALVLDADIALAAAAVHDDPRFGGDPADAIIHTTARLNRAALVTRDRALRAYDRAATVW